MKKRILSILLLCCMVLTLLPTTAFAADESPAVTNVTVTFDSNGGGEVKSQTIQQGQQVQRPADPVKEGYTFIGWYDKNDLDNKYYNMPEWNFRYSVTGDMELVAQWMASMPISTEPITYLDKDGNQQVCNKYTVLTSNTAGSMVSTMQHSSRMLSIRFFIGFSPPVRVGSVCPSRLFSDFLCS